MLDRKVKLAGKSELDHLMNIAEAKSLVESVLKPRISAYEDRLKKPWYERGIDYLTSNNYGEAGYKRTKKFLEEMQKISRTEDLIHLTAKEFFQEGVNLPHLLRQIVVHVSGFTPSHINLIKRDLQAEIAKDQNRYAKVRLLGIYEQAINRMYKKIIASNDCGGCYLYCLNNRLNQNSSIELRKIN